MVQPSSLCVKGLKNCEHVGRLDMLFNVGDFVLFLSIG